MILVSWNPLVFIFSILFFHPDFVLVPTGFFGAFFDFRRVAPMVHVGVAPLATISTFGYFFFGHNFYHIQTYILI